MLAATIRVCKNHKPSPGARTAYVSTANGPSARKTGCELGMMEGTKPGDAQTWLTTVSRLKGDSHRTSDNHTAQMNYHPLPHLPRLVIAKIMVLPPLVMMNATTIVGLNAQGPLPLLGITTPPYRPVVRELTVTAIVDDCQHGLAAPTAILVNEAMGRLRSDHPCHHAGVHSSTGCRMRIA